MAGVFPVRASFCERPQGLGYVEATVVLSNPFHPRNTALKGHEFHYTRCEFLPGARAECALRLDSGAGMGQAGDGLVYKSVFASYMQIFALAVPHWAERFVAAAAEFAGDGIGGACGPRMAHANRWQPSGASVRALSLWLLWLCSPSADN
jgi:cobyrinic acid a,c-diamide synthase